MKSVPRIKSAPSCAPVGAQTQAEGAKASKKSVPPAPELCEEESKLHASQVKSEKLRIKVTLIRLNVTRKSQNRRSTLKSKHRKKIFNI